MSPVITRLARRDVDAEIMPKRIGSVLHEFITVNREDIIARCRAKVATRSIPPPSEAEIAHGVPLFLDQLVDALRSGTSTMDIDRSAGQHGLDLLTRGFTVSQVVHDYGNVCQTIPNWPWKRMRLSVRMTSAR